MRSISALLILVIAATLAGADEAKSAISTEAVQVIGFGDIDNNTKGTLELKNGVLSFSSKKNTFNVTAGSIRDIATGNDTQRTIGGKVGTISQFAPYGGGRVLSLFRDKIDTLTIQYRDADGGLHGAIFTMAVGAAEPFKKALLAEGAQTTVPAESDSTARDTHPEAQEPRQ